MNHIYVIEDDVDLCSELALTLESAGYCVSSVNRFDHIIEEFQQLSPDLILMDVNLPCGDGFNLCLKIRKISQIPIIFLTGRSSQIDELQALSFGGDDYITKPYNVPILLARIKNALKRTSLSDENRDIEYNGLKLNLSSGIASYGSKSVELSKREVQILSKLVAHAGDYVSRITLIENLWDTKQYIDDNTLSVNITRLREKLASLGLRDFIHTKRGIGYKV